MLPDEDDTDDTYAFYKEVKTFKDMYGEEFKTMDEAVISTVRKRLKDKIVKELANRWDLPIHIIKDYSTCVAARLLQDRNLVTDLIQYHNAKGDN